MKFEVKENEGFAALLVSELPYFVQSTFIQATL